MNTQTHVLMGAVLFGGTVSGGQTAAAVVGGLLPDLPAILMVVWARWWAARSPREIFGTLYFSRRWQVLLAPWHSVPLWGAGVALGWASASPVLIAFAASGLIHVGIDFFLHASDAHRHFWPFSDWRFESPVSYWDSAHHGRLFQPFEAALAIGLTSVLLMQYTSVWAVAALGVVLVLYVAQMAYFLRALPRQSRKT